MNKKTNQGYIIHFGEIALKGKNRKQFEDLLIKNLENKIGKFDFIYEYGKLIILSNEKNVSKALNTTFGIANRSKCFILPAETSLNQNLIENIINIITSQINFNKVNTFKIETKRSNKKFQPNSLEINKTIASEIIKTFPHLKINFDNPNKTIFIEIGQKGIYLYFEKIKGLGGLPTGSSGKIVSLISGGIDSPVASRMLMKRGAEIIFLHGYTKALDKDGKNKEKIKKIVKSLSQFQGKSKIYFVDVSYITRQIVENIPPKRRMLIFKRSLIKIANEIAQKEGALSIVTGDSLAQVASQTLENINVIFDASNLPILTPLIGFDKTEIIDLAKKIGTYDISILPSQDWCSKISHKHPITKGKIDTANQLETNIKIHPLNYELEIIEHHQLHDAIEKKD